MLFRSTMDMIGTEIFPLVTYENITSLTEEKQKTIMLDILFNFQIAAIFVNLKIDFVSTQRTLEYI